MCCSSKRSALTSVRGRSARRIISKISRTDRPGGPLVRRSSVRARLRSIANGNPDLSAQGKRRARAASPRPELRAGYAKGGDPTLESRATSIQFKKTLPAAGDRGSPRRRGYFATRCCRRGAPWLRSGRSLPAKKKKAIDCTSLRFAARLSRYYEGLRPPVTGGRGSRPAPGTSGPPSPSRPKGGPVDPPGPRPGQMTAAIKGKRGVGRAGREERPGSRRFGDDPAAAFNKPRRQNTKTREPPRRQGGGTRGRAFAAWWGRADGTGLTRRRRGASASIGPRQNGGKLRRPY